MPSEIFLLVFAVAAAALLFLILRPARRAVKRGLEPERLAAIDTSPRRVRSSRPRRRPPSAVKQSALLPGRHAGQ